MKSEKLGSKLVKVATLCVLNAMAMYIITFLTFIGDYYFWVQLAVFLATSAFGFYWIKDSIPGKIAYISIVIVFSIPVFAFITVIGAINSIPIQ